MTAIRLTGAAVAAGFVTVMCAGPALAVTAEAADEAVQSTAAPNASTSAADQSSRSAEIGGLEEVVVTANRRLENEQRVPVAVTAISADKAAAVGVTDMQSLANAVPGLRIDRATATAIPFLRGVGSPVGQVSAEPSVAFYVDDIYTPASGAALSNFNSIERLEVEKGPQGTLFGRNATGGVIQVFTKNPTAQPELDLTAGYARFNAGSGSAYATGGLTDNLAANIALYGGNQGEGWGHNVTTGNPAFDTNRYYGGRIKFLWTPTQETTVLFAVDHDDTKSDEGFYGPVKGTVGAGFYPAPSGFYDLSDHNDPFWDVKQTGASLKVTQDMQWSRLVSISGYRRTNQYQMWDQSGAPIPIVDVRITGPDRTFTQELQLLSPDNSSLTWIGGLFFMSDRSGYDPLRIAGAAVNPLPFAATFTSQTTKSYAGFAQVTWPMLKDTNLTAGLRYTKDNREITASQNLGDFIVGPVSNSPQSASYSKPTGRLALDHQFTDDIMAYVSYNRGFKSGTFNAVVFPGSTIGPPVKPETLDDYSVGAKTEFWDHRLRINTEAFWYSYKNIQITQIIAGGTSLTNAAKATIKGVDIDAVVEPIERLTVTAAVEALDGKYDDYPGGLLWLYSPGCSPGSSNCSVVPGPNLKGNKTIDTPPFSFSLRTNYVYPTHVGDLDFNIAYNHSGGYYFDADNGKGQLSQSFDRQPLLNIVDLSVGWTAPGGKYDVRLWGKNITGQKYDSFGFEEALLTQYAPAPPATYGVTFGVHFQ
jgi:iron complex outermembrane receptor protein